WVRVALIPHPMSTPTQAGITTSEVGTTDPTVEPIPQCASGISATCGLIHGSDAVRIACSSACSSRMLAHDNRPFTISFMALRSDPVVQAGAKPLAGHHLG